MEGLIIAIYCVALAVAVIAAMASIGNQARNRMLTEFAETREGRLLVPARIFSDEPVLSAQHRGYGIRLFDGHRRPGHQDLVTEVRLDVTAVNPLGFSFEIYPETILHKVAKLIWLEDVEVLDPPFDDAFILRTNSVPALKRILTDRCRLFILQLHGLRNEPDTYLKLDRDQLTISKGRRFQTAGEMAQFYDLCEGIFDCVLGFLGAPGVDPQEASILFLDADESPRLLAAAAPVCQLCGEPVTSNGVACARCGTVHHRDCWVYNGECTTYACGSTRFVPGP